ncbi:hypothetical protein Dimus_023140 [Dionaea muscipula]
MGSMSKQFGPEFPPGGGGFVTPAFQFDWRQDPRIPQARARARRTIFLFLAKYSSRDFVSEIADFAVALENQLFDETESKDCYLNGRSILARLEWLIRRNWLCRLSVREGSNQTGSTVFPFPAAAVPSQAQNDSAGANLFDPSSGCVMASSTSFRRWILTADDANLHSSANLPYSLGSQNNHFKLEVSASDVGRMPACHSISPSAEQSMSDIYSLGNASHYVHPLDNGWTVLANAPQLVSESSLGSCHEQLQFANAQNNANLERVDVLNALPTIVSNTCGTSDKVHMVELVNFRSDLQFNELLDTKGASCSGFAVNDSLHLKRCNDGKCNCEQYKLLLNHIGNCQSSFCPLCGPALKPDSRSSSSGHPSISCSNSHGMKRPSCYTAEASPITDKRCKLDRSSLKTSSIPGASPVIGHILSPDGPLNIQASGSPSFSNSEATELKVEVDTVHEHQSASSDSLRKDDIDHLLRPKSEQTSNVSVELSADYRKMTELTSTRDAKAKSGVNFHTIYSKAMPILSEEQHVAEKEDVMVMVKSDETVTETNAELMAESTLEQHLAEKEDVMVMVKSDETVAETNAELMAESTEEQHIAEEDVMVMVKSDETVPETNAELMTDSTACGTQMKSEKQKVLGVSLTEFFTADEVKQHQQSLRPLDQIAAEEVSGSTIRRSGCVNTCQLCYLDKLVFPPLPIFCFSCDLRIKNHVTYYSMVDENGAQSCICSRCYSKPRGGNIKMLQLSIPKSKLVAKKNDVVTEESWVQCDKCEQWQHQVCALFIDKKDVEGQAEYICPKCYLEELNRGDRIPLPRTTGFGASNLPSTKLSAHIEQWLLSHLKKEREERAKAVGKGPYEVPGAADLVVRVVASVDKELKVKQQFLDIFRDKNYPAEFPYRSKVILLFQRIDGVDVCLFTMYVQEFGSHCSPPNRRSVNIAYLDSVKYFRPAIKTLKGEALRTFVYHQILNGYLDYCKKRGFAICYIWACPPPKGEDFILYCHPQAQKTPQRDKLNLWYRTMLKKSTEQNVAVHFTSLWEPIFASDAEGKAKVTAARLPYDGDYLSGIVEGMIKKIEEDSGGDLQKKLQQIPKRSLKALGYINPSADDAKDILLMHQLNSIIESKDQFFVIYLQYICNSCHEVILSGTRWFCNYCKNYQLCEGCHHGDTHTTSNGQKHILLQKSVDNVPLDTEDDDAILDNCFLENRHAFLSFCQGNNYQFDTLRRAKHSSTMILYHLHNATRSSIGSSCSLCLMIMEVGPRWICRMCPEFNVCAACYKKNGSASHTHNLIHHPPAVDQRTENLNAEKGKAPQDIVLHVFRCCTSDCCVTPNCRTLKKLIDHSHKCQIRFSGGCQCCRKLFSLLVNHAKICTDSDCGVPYCRDLKNRWRPESHSDMKANKDNNPQLKG